MKNTIFLCCLLLITTFAAHAQSVAHKPNLATIASATGENPDESYQHLQDGVMPANAPVASRWRAPKPGVHWVQYEWQQPVAIREIALYWHQQHFTRLPLSYRIQYWDGQRFVPVKNAKNEGIINHQLSQASFDEIKTSKLRLEVDSTDLNVSALQEWIVYETPGTAYPPVVAAGPDRAVMLNGKTYLSGKIKSITPIQSIIWKKVSGPGNVNFSNAGNSTGTATFTVPGNYILSLTASNGKAITSPLKVKVVTPPPAKRLDVVYTRRYKIDSKLWNARAKAMIVNWIPFCIAQCERTDLNTGEGGIDNFLEAAKAIRGEAHTKHKGYVFSNAWVHQTVEAICEALMVDPQGDTAIIAAQQRMQETLDKWIPIILAAQETDGYLQTAWTLRDTSHWHQRWSPVESRGNHEGYVAGYFLESAINHYTLTEGKDKRLYDAAKKLADCWVTNIGPGKKEWYDGHQEMEQALVRFGRFVNDMEGHQSHGDSYIQLAKFLLDSRGGGSEYDQSHLPVQQQYEAVGHAVRATYNYSGMSDVAAETGDVDYQSAVMSLWDNMVNKKYYITGGIGSGETSEGFGGNYSLGNDAYCESCSSCGLIFFQHKMNIAYHDAKYADLYEETMYNALLGSLSLDGKDFTYTNALSTSQPRYEWHVCPCCVGNIPRTLLMMPTWAYVRGDAGVFVNLFAGSTIKVDQVAGTNVEMVQKTDYPWSGKVSITVNPEDSKAFTVYIRVPDRSTSELYTAFPTVKGLKALAVNGKKITPVIKNGYAAITQVWKKGDHIDLELPMEIQRVTADPKIAADKGMVALRYGPLIYNVEAADQDIDKTIGVQPLTLQWRPDLLDGVMVITGKWSDGTPLLAIPNFARMNRVTPTVYPASTQVLEPGRVNEPPRYVERAPTSRVWINK